MLQLGEINNPLTGQATIDLNGAKFNIDLLNILKEKTEGNLEDQEKEDLEKIVYELKMLYVKKTGSL